MGPEANVGAGFLILALGIGLAVGSLLLLSEAAPLISTILATVSVVVAFLVATLVTERRLRPATTGVLGVVQESGGASATLRASGRMVPRSDPTTPRSAGAIGSETGEDLEASRHAAQEALGRSNTERESSSADRAAADESTGQTGRARLASSASSSSSSSSEPS